MFERKQLKFIRPSQRSLVDQLRSRLIFTIALLVLCLLISAAMGVFATSRQQQFGDQKLAIHTDVSTLLQAMINQETGLRGYITTNDLTFLEPYTSGEAAYTAAVQSLRNDTVGPNFQMTSPALTTVETRSANWSNSYASVQIDDMQNGRLTAARDTQFNVQGKNLFDAFRRSVEQLQRATDSDLSSVQSQVSLINYIALAGSAILTVLAIIWLWNTFTNFTSAQRAQLDVLSKSAAAFGAGNLAVRVQGVTDADLREVGQTFNTMAATVQEQQNALRDRDILEQVSQLNSILTDSLDLTELMDKFFLSALPLLDIQIGALYLYDPISQHLRLFTSRGLSTATLPPTFGLGEGLLGRAAQERKELMVTRTEMDKDSAFQLKTMLGVALPASMYHLPLLRGNELLGVLAVGSLYPMREQTRNVFLVIASNMAAMISNTQAFAHIQAQAAELIALANEQELANQALRQQRDELTALNAALEEANLARSRFLSTMSHELRTPLTSIIGFGQMLLRTSARSPLTERQNGNIERILKNAQHLLALINDVLDLAKVEAGRMDVNATEVNLRELLEAVVDETRSVALSRGLNVTVNVADEVAVLETDPLKLRQIVLNLLSNALKFTEHGGVTLSATHRTISMSSTNGSMNAEQVVLAVQDTGVGIPSDQQARIFEAFYQIDNSNSRSYGGTGLGLSIVRELTSLLGGKVEIESQVGEGTTFTVLLPLHVRDRQSLQDVRLNTLHNQVMAIARPNGKNGPLRSVGTVVVEEERSSSDELLVVAIDDNPDVLQLIAAALEQSPYRVVGIQDSTQAVAMVQELRPHVVTLDIMMPRVNGWQILHQLKSNPATASIPVILLTVLEDRSAGYVLGADEYLVKPVARDALISTLQQLTGPHRITRDLSAIEIAALADASSELSTLTQQEEEQGEAIKPILLVHKESDVHGLVERLVHETGYSIQATNEAQDIMDLITQKLPDMLMLLVQMDGQGIHDGEFASSSGADHSASTYSPDVNGEKKNNLIADKPGYERM